jgi:hypothetical protein
VQEGTVEIRTTTTRFVLFTPAMSDPEAPIPERPTG